MYTLKYEYNTKASMQKTIDNILPKSKIKFLTFGDP